MDDKYDIRLVLFDFGGVIAEEGYREGLKNIARKHGLDPDAFYESAVEAIHYTGYLFGTAPETAFWDELAKQWNITADPRAWRKQVLDRFVIRPWMPDLADRLRSLGYMTAILSDQTDWLDELEARHGFFKHYDRVFNSFHLGKGKRDPSLFDDVTGKMGVLPGRCLFIDDSRGHVERAKSRGLNALLYDFGGKKEFLRALREYLPVPEDK